MTPKEQNFDFFWPKYHLSAGLETKFPTNNRLYKKSKKLPKYPRNIGNSRYFGEILRLYLMRACAGIFEKISVNIGKILVMTILTPKNSINTPKIIQSLYKLIHTHLSFS